MLVALATQKNIWTWVPYFLKVIYYSTTFKNFLQTSSILTTNFNYDFSNLNVLTIEVKIILKSIFVKKVLCLKKKLVLTVLIQQSSCGKELLNYIWIYKYRVKFTYCN